MYCGCNPIALSSQTELSRTLIRLMTQKAYSSITVSELCRESGVSRQTFYSLFRSMDNVVVFTLRERVCSLPHETAEAAPTPEQLCRCYSRYICTNREFLKLLVENDVGYLLDRSIYETLSGCPGAFPEPLRDYAAQFLAGGLTGVVRQYCAQDPPPSEETLFAILYALLRGVYREGTG